MASPETTQLDYHALSGLIQRIEEAIANDLALSVEDMKLLLYAITTLCTLQSKMEQDDITLHKLRKLLGMVKQSEKRGVKDKDPNDKNPSSQRKKATSKKEKKPKKRTTPKTVVHAIKDHHKGDVCPECERGKLYPYTAGKLLRITGHPPFEATQHIIEQLRCNACEVIYKAPLPEEVLADGGPDQQYAYSARALMAIHKFYSGTPYYHQENLTRLLGYHISASTIFDQCEYVANDSMPVFYELQRQAAAGHLFLVDDTRHRILTQEPELRDNPSGHGQRLRTGVYASGLIAIRSDGHEVVLFDISLGHAGEHLDQILNYRPPGLAPPKVMNDALSSNTVTQRTIKVCYCNAHARRLFYDLMKRYPDEVGWVLDTYANIWMHESHIRKENMSDQQRLAYHQEHSLPVMTSLHQWATNKMASDSFEEHSALGKAIQYFLKYYEGLVMFCVELGAPIDNNRMEEKLKIVIRGRKTSHFYKTITGAGVANVLISLIATADQAGANSYEYLQAIQRHHQAVKENPKNWLPWNYLVTLENMRIAKDLPEFHTANAA